MNAELLSVGTELLLGDILNTNAMYLSKELASLGISIYYQSTVGDNSKRVEDAFELAFSRADLVITTGGLGPTDDDLTKEIACKYFNKELILNEQCKNHIENYYKNNDKGMPKSNLKQAYIPSGATVLQNDNGTANGIMIEENNKILIMMPGPPDEVVPMFEKVVKPLLKSRQKTTIISRNIHLSGIGESRASEVIQDLIQNCKNPTVAPYAKPNEVLFRITANVDNENEASKIIDPIAKEIYSRLGEYIYGEDGTTLIQSVMDSAIKRGLTVATAESCTGGMLASRFVDYEGASKAFLNGVVSYSNESKCKLLGVDSKTLDTYGAVSEEVAIQMAKGIKENSGASVGIATTGIAGPDGGTSEKPVGLVYICLYSDNKTMTKCLNIKGNRQKVRERTVAESIELFRRYLQLKI